MPNYCENTFKIKGSICEIDRFLEENVTASVGMLLEKTKYTIDLSLDFNKILPTPSDDELGEVDGWYDWRIENWGTKWNVCDTFCFSINKIDDDLAELTTVFNTAWTPPTKIYDHLFEKYKDTSLEFYVDYYEGGCAFAGELKVKNNEVIENIYHECNSSNEETKLNYYAYLIEKGFESPEWLEEELYERMDGNDIEDEVIDKTIIEFSSYVERKKFKEAAKFFLDIINN